MSRILAASVDYAASLDESRRELLEAAHKFASADERQKARAELIASVPSNITPNPGEPVKLTIDDDGTAHIPIVGGLTPAVANDPCGALSNQAETEYGFIQAAIASAENDPRVARVVFDVDSPGGDVTGLDKTAQAMATMQKPSVARVHNLAASAAYYLASQADQIVAMSPMAQIGSIGIVSRVSDDKGDGVKTWRFVSSGAPNKRPDPSTETGRDVIQSRVDAIHEVFVRRVAEGRGVSEDVVRSTFGQGDMLLAEKAFQVGMIDAVEGVHLSRKNKSASSSSTAKTSGGHKVTLNEFMAENPGVIEARDKTTFDAGIQAERKRRDDLAAFRGINQDGDKAVEDAISSGKSYADANPVIQAAILRGKTPESADGENAQDLATSEDKKVAIPEGMTLEDVLWFQARGYSDEEIAAMAKEKK